MLFLHKRRNWITPVLMLGTLVAVTACSPSQPVTAPTSKEAFGILRHVNHCIVNARADDVSLTWQKGEYGVSTFTGEGKLKSGDSFCAEGSSVRAFVTFSDGFGAYVVATNFPLTYPDVRFESRDSRYQPDKTLGYILYVGTTLASASYAQGETVESDIEGHHVSVTRHADTEWVNFDTTLLP